MWHLLKQLVPSHVRKSIGESSWFLALYPKAKHDGLSFCFHSKWHVDFFNSDPEAYECLERKFVKRYVGPEDAVLEIGGCMGVVACETNRLLKKPSRHLVVEASPVSAAYLGKNRNRNQCDFAIENGLVSKTSDGVFYCNPHNPLASSQNAESEVCIHVPVLGLPALLNKWKIAPNVLIMDIEGGEYGFLLENLPDLPQLSAIICEFHPSIIGDSKIEEAYEVLRSHGFCRKEHESQHSHFVDVWVRTA